MTEHVEITGGVLVGHDGSDHADAALRCGRKLAERIDVRLHVLRSWVMSSAPRPKTWAPGYVPPLAEYEQAVRDALARDLEAAGLVPGDSVQLHVVHGSAARRLISASAGADLLVVARRGHGGFVGLGMGAVSDQCIRHAACPVVVLPADTTDLGPAEADRGVAGSDR